MSPLLLGLAFIFTLMSVFYVVRLMNKKAVSICCGTWNPWNEVVHIIAGLVMVGMVTPTLFTGQLFFMTIICAVFALCYTLALLSPLGPVRYWKMLHVHMYLSMALMCATMSGLFMSGMLVTLYGVVVNIIIVHYFGKALLYCIAHDPPLPYALGSNISHIIMALTMILMFVFPETFMIGHAHHH